MEKDKTFREQLREKYKNEEVFVIQFVNVPKTVTQNTHFIPCKEDIFNIIAKSGYYKLRSEVEMNTNYKQIITYAVVSNNGKYLATRRLKGDERLRSQISLGVGGHISPEDYNDMGIEFINNALKREVTEEIDLNNATQIEVTFLGLINDNTTEVSQDHLGLLFSIEIKSEQPIDIKEKDKLEAIFFTKDEILDNYDQLENWSKIYVDSIIKNWGLV